MKREPDDSAERRTQNSETVFALATPAHPSSLALIRISGAEALGRCRTLLSGNTGPARGSFDTTINLPLGAIPAWAWVLPAPGTLTGEDVLELLVPGNPDIVRQLEERLRELGCRDADPGEFTRRALHAGKLDLSRAEAVLQLITASDDAAHRQAVADLKGETAARIARITERLRALSARFEMTFDFSEEEHADPQVLTLRRDLQALVRELEKVVGLREARPHRERPVVALFGPPNAGKSTLFNALLGLPRSLVSDVPGTTRDPVEAECTLGPHIVMLVDLSGVGATDADRGRFAEPSRERALQSDVLLALDASGSDETLVEFRMLESRDPSIRTRALWVHTKSDLGQPGAVQAGLECVSVSAVSGGGLDSLRARLVERLDQIASGDATSLLRLRSRAAYALLRQAIDENAPPEVAASDLRRALILLDEALLSDAPGEVLDLIFSRFCIGK
ncbi:MAG: 50S ribosome-binding GTPase [Planctomycetes bacterium]|nr:50S ribosome-binding GTPase [Planctomycetota bacterium]